jgi:hypothetical protein
MNIYLAYNYAQFFGREERIVSRRIVVVILAVLLGLCLVSTGCAKKKKKSAPPPPIDLDYLDDPGAPSALTVSDPTGDASLGDDADWTDAVGTYDTHYIYLRVNLYGSTNLANVTGVVYVIGLDNDRNGVFNTGDYGVAWVPDTDQFLIMDMDGNEVGGQKEQRLGNGVWEVAIPRSLCNPDGPDIDFETGDMSGNLDDRMPDSAPFAQFRY